MVRFMGTVCDIEHWILVGRQKYKGMFYFRWNQRRLTLNKISRYSDLSIFESALNLE